MTIHEKHSLCLKINCLKIKFLFLPLRKDRDTLYLNPSEHLFKETFVITSVIDTDIEFYD